MNTREFTAVYKKRGRGYIAWIEELPGVNTQGETRKETEENLKEALLLILDANRKLAQRSGSVVREPLRIGVPRFA